MEAEIANPAPPPPQPQQPMTRGRRQLAGAAAAADFQRTTRARKAADNKLAIAPCQLRRSPRLASIEGVPGKSLADDMAGLSCRPLKQRRTARAPSKEGPSGSSAHDYAMHFDTPVVQCVLHNMEQLSRPSPDSLDDDDLLYLFTEPYDGQVNLPRTIIKEEAAEIGDEIAPNVVAMHCDTTTESAAVPRDAGHASTTSHNMHGMADTTSLAQSPERQVGMGGRANLVNPSIKVEAADSKASIPRPLISPPSVDAVLVRWPEMDENMSRIERTKLLLERRGFSDIIRVLQMEITKAPSNIRTAKAVLELIPKLKASECSSFPVAQEAIENFEVYADQVQKINKIESDIQSNKHKLRKELSAQQEKINRLHKEIEEKKKMASLHESKIKDLQEVEDEIKGLSALLEMKKELKQELLQVQIPACEAAALEARFREEALDRSKAGMKRTEEELYGVDARLSTELPELKSCLNEAKVALLGLKFPEILLE